MKEMYECVSTPKNSVWMLFACVPALPNKDIKLIRPTKTASMEEPFQHLNILYLPKLFTLSVGKFMQFYYNSFQTIFDDYFTPIRSIHSYSTRLSASNNLFLPRVNSSSAKYSLVFVGPKVWSLYQTVLSLLSLLTITGNLRNTSYIKRHIIIYLYNSSFIKN